MSVFSTYSNGSTFFKRKRSLLPILICSLGLLLGGCGGSSTGTNGGGSGGGGGNGGGGGGNEIGTEPTFSNVQQIFQQSCGGANCHINQPNNGVQLNTYENVMNSQGSDYGELVVQPGDAEGSPLVDKIEPNPQIPPRMPDGGPYLSDERIDQIRQWIDNGAENN